MTKKAKERELQEGDLIQHTTQDYGPGRIMTVKDGMALISFKNLGKRRFPIGSKFLELVEPVETDETNEPEAAVEEEEPTAAAEPSE